MEELLIKLLAFLVQQLCSFWFLLCAQSGDTGETSHNVGYK